jgi:hypothetical protein
MAFTNSNGTMTYKKNRSKFEIAMKVDVIQRGARKKDF